MSKRLNMRVKALAGLISIFAVLMLISSCSSKKVKRKPAPLAPQVVVGAKFKINWSIDFDSDSTFQLLQPFIDEDEILSVSTTGRLSTVNHDGDLIAQNWLEPVSSGVSKTSLGVAYVNQNGFIQHRGKNFELLWSGELKALAFNAPIEVDGQLIVQTIDDRISSFDLATGQLQWVNQIVQPELTIKGQTAPLVYNGNIIAAFANGRVVSINAKSGKTNWEYSLKGAVSSNVLESLLDIDAPMQMVGNQLFVIGNHGNMTVLNLNNGNALWEKDIQSLKAFAIDEINNRLYLVLVDGSLTAIDIATGTYAWHEKFLLYRNPTGIVLVNGVLLVGDYEGYLHAVSTKNGMPLNRLQIDRSSIQTKIVEYNGSVYIQSQSGKLISLSVSEI